jgi:fructokinase
MTKPLIAAIEAGGTKFNCSVGTGPGDLRSSARIPTTTPAETLQGVIAFFEQATKEYGPFAAMGVGSFGPLVLNQASQAYGTISATPKVGWTNADLLGPLRARFSVPMALDTDVNAAALGEHLWGAGQDVDSLVYITIGTGIGGGAMVNGKLVHGMLHPEMGHMQVAAPVSSAPNPACTCPFHTNCLEGYLCGPAVEKRWGAPAGTFPEDHECWDEFATILAGGLVNLITILSPQRIILGGGVMHQAHLFPNIHREVLRQLNGYIQTNEILQNVASYIVPPGLGDEAGILGSLALGLQAINTSPSA